VAGTDIDPVGLVLTTARPENVPVVHIHATSSLDGQGLAVEHAYRVDHGLWRSFSPGSDIEVRDDFLRIQGLHTIEVRSRVAGDPRSIDPTPAVVSVLIAAPPSTPPPRSAVDPAALAPGCATTPREQGGLSALLAVALVALGARWRRRKRG
jgi:uncharacterized protein (TIGR03382 family)